MLKTSVSYVNFSRLYAIFGNSNHLIEGSFEVCFVIRSQVFAQDASCIGYRLYSAMRMKSNNHTMSLKFGFKIKRTLWLAEFFQRMYFALGPRSKCIVQTFPP